VNRKPNTRSSRRKEALIKPELSLTPCFSRVCCAGPCVGTVLTVSFCAWAPPKTETVKTVELPEAAPITSLKRGVNERRRKPTQNPKGIPQQSPSLRQRSVRKANSVPVVLVSPGKTPPNNDNPERVVVSFVHIREIRICPDSPHGIRRDPSQFELPVFHKELQTSQVEKIVIGSSPSDLEADLHLGERRSSDPHKPWRSRPFFKSASVQRFVIERHQSVIRVLTPKFDRNLPVRVDPCDDLIESPLEGECPPGCFLSGPLQEAGKCISANLPNGLTRALGFVRLPCVQPFRINFRPLTQFLPPILRLPLGPQDQRNHTNQHPNSDQTQVKSSLSHGAIIMLCQQPEASPNAQQQGGKFSQKQTKITKRGKGIYETSSFPSFPSVQISPQIINHKS